MEHKRRTLKLFKRSLRHSVMCAAFVFPYCSHASQTVLPVIGPMVNNAAPNTNAETQNPPPVEQVHATQPSQALQISQAVNSVTQTPPTEQVAQPVEQAQPAALPTPQPANVIAEQPISQPPLQPLQAQLNQPPVMMSPPVAPQQVPGAISKIGVQFYGSVLPSGILIQTSSGIVQLPIAVSTNQTIVAGNTYLKSVFEVVQKNGSNVLSNNPVVTLFPEVNHIANHDSGQSVDCYYKSGLLYITYSSEDGSVKNPVQNYADIKALNELFQSPDIFSQYFVYTTVKGQHRRHREQTSNLVAVPGQVAVSGYVGQVIAVGTTVVPGDTICVARYALPQQ